MPTQVIMPQLGESVVEGIVSKWLKARGEPVKEFEPLLEINTDKVDSEIPSPVSGVLLDILVPEGSNVHAGAVLALIGGPEEARTEEAALVTTALGTTSSSTKVQSATAREAPQQETPKGMGETAVQTAQPEAPVAATPISPGQSRELGFISPVVAKIAQEQGVDLSEVQGTGQGGRITKKDILAYIDQRQAIKAAAGEARVEPVKADGGDRRAVRAPSETVVPNVPAPIGPSTGEVLPFTAVRRAIAEHMVYSKHTSPHVTTVMEADLSRVVANREANKAAFARDGANLTYTAYFISAIVGALKAYPIVNSSWSEEGILLHKEINLGIATSMGEAGLIVPVIKNADTLSLLGLARAINDLSGRARARQLKPEEVKGGTFTITNHGTTGSLFATPIINQPQCAILGAGAIQKRVVVLTDPAGNDSLAIRPMIYLTLTFDHRILDGAIGDTFLSKVVELLQNWG